jgi:DNA-binding response OmpR family regulator
MDVGLELLLVVEDDEALRFMLADFLVLEGFNVRTAEHGIEALRFLEQHSPGLVILDLVLPWVDGFGVLSTMRLRPSVVQTPVIVITGTNTTEQQLSPYKPVRLLRKPFEPQQLLQLIFETLPGG